MKAQSWRAYSIVVSLLAAGVQGGLRIPYPADDTTLHLWHFDGAFTNANGTTNIVTPDAVSGGITLTNYGQPYSTFADGDPPSGAYTNIALGTAGFAGLGNGLHLVDYSKLASGNLNALAYGGVYGPAATFANPVSGAFTWEALVKLDANPFLANNGNWEILSGDGNVNGNANRAWQFRIQTGPSANLNLNAFPGVNAAVNNLTAALPNSGPNAVVTNQWYHVAVSYTGASPTNGDTPGVVTFYWTLLDANRNAADALLVTNVGAGFGLATDGNTQFAVGGSGRNFPGTLGNNEGFKGYLDEVRMSVVALRSIEMAFTSGGAVNPGKVVQQPPASTVVGFGQTLTVAALVSGTQPYVVQWQQNGPAGFTNVLNQTNSALVISNVGFSAAGDYRLTITNAFGGDASIVTHVSVLASLSELFATGVDTNGALAAGGPGVVDPHYRMTESADTNNFGLNSIIWDMAAYPIAASGGNFENPDGVSQWIGPRANGSATTSGGYVFHTEFLVDTGDPGTASLAGIWWVNTAGLDILLNGVSTGHSNNVAQKPGTAFTITNGFVAGLNTLDFVITNSGAGGPYPQTGFRVEMNGLAQPLSPGKPVIATPPADVTVREGGHARFSVVALGRPPLTYQWRADNSPLPGATNRTLRFDQVFSGGQGTNFQVIVTSESLSVTSTVARLTLVPTNRPPVAATLNLATAPDQPLDISISRLLRACSDPDDDALSFLFADVTSTNFGSVIQNDALLSYVPPGGYIGADQFSYTIGDDQFASTVGLVRITVTPLSAPLLSAQRAGANVILSATGGTPGGSYHLLSSSDVAAPPANWTSTAGTFDAGGNLSVTNPIASGPGQTFYRIQIP